MPVDIDHNMDGNLRHLQRKSVISVRQLLPEEAARLGSTSLSLATGFYATSTQAGVYSF